MELKGKIINFIGDSITEGVGVADIPNNRYDNRIKKAYGLAATNNYGISGSRLAHQTKPSEHPRADLCFCGRIWDMDKRADVIVVYGGVNDYIHGDAPFGTLSDRTPATFCGGVDFLMRNLPVIYPNAKIVFMTPAHEKYGNIIEAKPSPDPAKIADARPLCEYVNVIKEKGEELGVHVLSLFDKLGIDPNKEEDSIKYTSDGLHFNDEGHARLAKCLGEFLGNL